jgi:hypothetical protein
MTTDGLAMDEGDGRRGVTGRTCMAGSALPNLGVMTV